MRRNGVVGLLVVAAACLALPLSPRPLAAATVEVKDVNISGVAAGDTIAVPVEVWGITPAEFVGFQFQLEYDAGALEFLDVTRGGLIGAKDEQFGLERYDRHAWALEYNAVVADNALRVAGLIILDNEVAGWDIARLAQTPPRVAESGGLLLLVNFRILQKTESVVRLSTDAAALQLLARDTFSADPPPPPGQVDADYVYAVGGPNLGELPNWWQIKYFGQVNVDPAAPSPDDSGFTNKQQFLAGTDPNNPDDVPDVVVFTLELKGGVWNLVSLPVVPLEPSPTEVFGDSLRTAWGWNAEEQGYYRPDEIFAKTGYWVMVDEDVQVDVTGNYPATSTVTLYPGWNLVGPALGDKTLPAAVRTAWAWSVEPPVGYRDPGDDIVEGAGYWMMATEEAEVW